MDVPAEVNGMVDLHAHTLASDGVLTPTELVEAAHRARLAALAVTDHDTVAALPEAAAAARPLGLRIVPGVEISAAQDGSSIHVLGYLFDADAPGWRDTLERFRDGRAERARAMVERLGEIGAPVELERVLQIAGDAPVGRPHIAEALLEAGHVDSFQGAFQKFIGVDRPGYVARPMPSPADAIHLIHSAGGVASLAHPGSTRRDDLISGMVAAGLDAIEVWHPRHDKRTRERYQALADEHDLVPTGGSDYHGGKRGDAQVGEQPVPLATLALLEERAQARS